jgi:chromosome segregation ATPase
VESLLAFAEELERRDVDVAEALDDLERRQREVDEVRSEGAVVAAFLAALPAARAESEGEERAAEEEASRAAAAVDEAEAAVAGARRDDDRLAAERRLQQARDERHSAEHWIVQARERRERLERDAAARRVEAARLERRAHELSPAVRDVVPPAVGLDAALEWAAQARGALLLEHSRLARRREEIVREAAELVTSVTGEPAGASAVAGVRDRLARVLGPLRA